MLAAIATALVALLLQISEAVLAAEPAINVRSAEVTSSTDGYYLDASFEIDIGRTLDEALTKGVALNFVLDFSLIYERWYLLNLWNKTVADFEQRYRLTYNSLTRQYRIAAGALTQNVDTLHEALAVMGQVRNRFIVARDDVDPDKTYTAELRLRLDTSQLPKAFQVNALGSKGWNLSSEWYRWTVRP
ncbi:MAG: DUF4390 domain-containing protein [Betaproteobacteria bacterium]